MGYDPSRKAWVMGYRRVMGYPPCPNFGRAKKYGVSEVMGYQKVWVMGNSTVSSSTDTGLMNKTGVIVNFR